MKREWRVLLAVAMAAALLAGCSAKKEKLPEPPELFETIQQEVELPEMVDLAEELLLDSTGISEDSYDSAVYLLLKEGTGPDEIVIIQATNQESAVDIQEKLEKRLEDKEKAAQVYLTEYMPIIQQGTVRKDGLTISLIVAEKAEEILQVYEKYQ